MSVPRTAVAEAEGFIGPTIGRSGYRTMAEFDAAVGAKYQSLVDQGYADTMHLVSQGLVKNDPMVIGSRVDAFARTGMRRWLWNAEGIQEGAGQIIRVNRRLYDVAGSRAYRIPDVYIPGAQRFRTLGEKRNASAALVSPDVDAYCVWDDDDIYLPWHLSAAAQALADADYSIPTALYVDKRTRLERKENQYLFHGAWAFRRSAFDHVCGYPFIQSGQDQGLLKRFKAAKLRRGDPIQFDDRPSYVYRWYTAHSSHLSAMGASGYERLGTLAAKRVTHLEPRWDRDWVQLHEQAIAKEDRREHARTV